MNSAADRFILPRRRVSVSQTLSNRFEPIRNPTGVGNQSVNHPRIALSDEGLELGFHLPGGKRGAAAGTQAGSP
jgi:hypothetical protein